MFWPPIRQLLGNRILRECQSWFEPAGTRLVRTYSESCRELDAFREGFSRTSTNALAAAVSRRQMIPKAPSEKNETRRPSNHHTKQKALRQCHCTPPFDRSRLKNNNGKALGRFRLNTQIYRIILRLMLRRTSDLACRQARLQGGERIISP
jgi:hypothetical protein